MIPTPCDALIIGGGPAGLMAAETLLELGHSVLLAEAKPTVARKFLMAGKSGLNLTRAQSTETFLTHYSQGQQQLSPMVRAFGPDQVQDWAAQLGQPLFIGSTGRVFPTSMKASPLLRAWLTRLETAGLQRRTQWRWTGWQDDTACFETPDGPQTITTKATVLALGGGSWARLGSDGAWRDIFANHGISTHPFAPSNTGLSITWTDHMRPVFGQPLKSICLKSGDLFSRSEVTIGHKGMEGGGLYLLTPALRQGAPLRIDLLPDLSHTQVQTRLSRTRGKQSTTSFLRKALRFDKTKMALINEVLRPVPTDPSKLADLLKDLPVPYAGLRPLDEAISTIGGVPWEAVDPGLMLTAKPGVFCAGEMLDWDAPTGGYLITACLATGKWAGTNAAQFIVKGRG